MTTTTRTAAPNDAPPQRLPETGEDRLVAAPIPGETHRKPADPGERGAASAPENSESVVPRRPAGLRRSGPRGITARGAYSLMLAGAAVGCGLGFILLGAVSIPTLAGWGLLAGSVAAALLASPRAGWFPAALPPLAMLTVVLVLGQLTLIGSRPTLVREVAMVVSNLTAMAPAQAASVAAVAGIMLVRQRLRRSQVPPAPTPTTP